MLDYLRAIFLCLFAALGWIVVREDLKVSKIRNLWLVRGLSLCLIGYAAYFALSLAGRSGWSDSYLAYGFYPAAVVHALISLAAGLALWLWDIWPAGDAKFFILCAIFTPLISPGQRNFPYLLSLDLLVNIFVLAATYVILDLALSLLRSLARPGLGAKLAGLRAGPRKMREFLFGPEGRWRRYSAQSLNTAGIFLAQTLAQPQLAARFPGWILSPVAVSLLLFILWNKLNRLISNGLLAVLSGAALLSFGCSTLLYPHRSPLLYTFLSRWFYFGVFFGSARWILEFYVKKRITMPVPISDIKPGMVLSEKSLALLRQDAAYFNARFTPLFKDGLSAPQAEALKQWLWGLPQQKTIEMLQGTPFGIWILSGTLFTLAARRNIASWALSWFQ